MEKIICFIFGHIRREKGFTGDYIDLEGRTDPFGRPTAMYEWKYWDSCPRCGKQLVGVSKLDNGNNPNVTPK